MVQFANLVTNSFKGKININLKLVDELPKKSSQVFDVQWKHELDNGKPDHYDTEPLSFLETEIWNLVNEKIFI